MIDIKTELVAALNAITSYPVYYELMYKPGEVPAITYKEIDNVDLYNGDTVSYSTIRYEIKVWDTSMANMISTSAAIDLKLKELGWSRYSSTEANYESNLLKVLRYVATGYNEV